MRVFRRSSLVCSFCGKGAAEVSKLVAGPRAYICDRCVAEAQRIMNTPDLPAPALPAPGRSFLARLVERVRKTALPLRHALA
jgi:ATP-dependent Clp protease ATP-binding subunit ClpX